MNLSTVEEKAKAVAAAFKQARNFGSLDSEPVGLLERAVRKTKESGEVYIPKGGRNPWDLYESKEGWEVASDAMTTAVREMLEAYLNAPRRDSKAAEKIMERTIGVEFYEED